MKIVCLDGGIINPGDVSWAPLESLGNLKVYHATDKKDFAKNARDAEIILVNKTPVFAQEIAALEKCRLVGVLATGVNNLDLRGLAEKNIKACNVPAYALDDIAQHAIALLLELARNTMLHSQSIKAGEWANNGEWCYWLKTPVSLYGKILGIIGFGGIGQITGRIASALGMKILAYSPGKKAEVDYPFEWAAPEEIFKKANVISLHAPLTPETEKIINEKNIALMQPGMIVINTARGGLVDEKAVASALKSRKLAAFGADVLSSEPPAADNPLLSAPNTILTPHMAWATARSRQNIIDIMAENISAFLEGRPQNIVN